QIRWKKVLRDDLAVNETVLDDFPRVVVFKEFDPSDAALMRLATQLSSRGMDVYCLAEKTAKSPLPNVHYVTTVADFHLTRPLVVDLQGTPPEDWMRSVKDPILVQIDELQQRVKADDFCFDE
ncbi:MAG: hypothetical protein JW750_09080, partial [Anaerolineaceae bacterium]|nr:hypothetical protein [Anaerolineaceae bacterium]